MNIISIDPAKANIGIYIKSGKKEHYTTINTTKEKTTKDKYLHIQKSIRELVKQYNIQVAFIEDYAYSIIRSQSVTKLAEVKGILLAVMYEHNIEVVKVNIQTWKGLAKVKLPDKARKKDYINIVNSYYKKQFKTTDECDAYMIALAMYSVYKGVIKTDSHLILQKKMKEIGKIF